MRILLLGGSGQLGTALRGTLADWADVLAPNSATANLENPGSLRNIIAETRSDLIINAAAYTAVDKAETDAEAAFAINGESLDVIGTAAAAINAPVVHFSTDYVFDGTADTPYSEKSTPHPVNIYGRSKLLGEEKLLSSGAAAWIFRVSWLYAASGQNFLLTMLRLFNERTEINVVDDQFGAPTSAEAVASILSKVLQHTKPQPDTSGIYHLTCKGQTTWFGFASACLEKAKTHGLVSGDNVTLHPISSDAYPVAAQRPAYSTLSNEKFETEFNVRMPEWTRALDNTVALVVQRPAPKC